MNRKKERTLGVKSLNGKVKKYLLPDGVRATDIKNLSEEDRDVLFTLKAQGRKTRYYFEARDQLDAVKRLKTRGLVVAVRRVQTTLMTLAPLDTKPLSCSWCREPPI
jgi:hypothetical protein